VAIEEELKGVYEGLEVGTCGLVGFSAVFKEGKISEKIGVVSKRASSSAFLDGSKGLEEGFRSDRKGRSLLVLGLGSSLITVWGRGVRGVCVGVEGSNNVLDGGRMKGGNRLGLLEGVEGALVFVEVGKALGFGGVVGGDGGLIGDGVGSWQGSFEEEV
jgi:hypothetical protein